VPLSRLFLELGWNFPQIGLELVVGTRGSSTTFGVVKGTRIVKKAPNDTQTVKLSTDSGIDTD
jgi:hypothetical protein